MSLDESTHLSCDSRVRLHHGETFETKTTEIAGVRRSKISAVCAFLYLLNSLLLLPLLPPCLRIRCPYVRKAAHFHSLLFSSVPSSLHSDGQHRTMHLPASVYTYLSATHRWPKSVCDAVSLPTDPLYHCMALDRVSVKPLLGQRSCKLA